MKLNEKQLEDIKKQERYKLIKEGLSFRSEDTNLSEARDDLISALESLRGISKKNLIDIFTEMEKSDWDKLRLAVKSADQERYNRNEKSKMAAMASKLSFNDIVRFIDSAIDGSSRDPYHDLNLVMSAVELYMPDSWVQHLDDTIMDLQGLSGVDDDEMDQEEIEKIEQEWAEAKNRLNKLLVKLKYKMLRK